MKFKKYLQENKIDEMGSELDLETGHVITKTTMKKMKKKYKTADEFIKNLKIKIKDISKQDENRIRSAYNEI